MVDAFTKDSTIHRVKPGLMAVIIIVRAKMVKQASIDAETGNVFLKNSDIAKLSFSKEYCNKQSLVFGQSMLHRCCTNY